jgi:hypothetical protein
MAANKAAGAPAAPNDPTTSDEGIIVSRNT